MRLTTIVFYISLVVAVALMTPMATFAQTSKPSAGELSISPVNERLNVAAGEEHISKVTITNKSNQTQTYTLSEVRFEMNSSGQIGLSNQPKLDWLSVANKSISIKPGKSQVVAVKITIPEKTSPSPYFPALLIDSKAAGIPKAQTGTGVGASVAYVIAINVIPGYPTVSVKITDLTVTNPVMDGKATVTYSMANTLNAYTKPSARLQILNGEGKQVYEEVINANLSTLAPGQVLSGKVELDEEQLAQLGQYKVQLLVLDEQFDTANFSETSFWVIQLPLLVGLILGGVAVLAIILAAGLYLFGKSGKNQSAEHHFK